jgi:hypothetical protein
MSYWNTWSGNQRRLAVRLSSLILIPAILSTPAVRSQQAGVPRFEDYTVTEMFKGTPAAPIFSTPESRQFRTRIRNGISTGAGVWNGSWKNPIDRAGPNFAGHYFVIRWGCGSECVTMAIVDAKTGNVYKPPLSAKGSLQVPLDNLSDMDVDVRPDSSLLVLRNGCSDFRDRKTCGNYYFNWKDNRFVLVKFVMVDTIQNMVH